ncbi:transposase [Streptomyces sp. NBC_01717]|uniref:transposase n=1 Tax=Streptomyces sp. NBC_01717 TaxID=2975918 RepID=UPI003FCC3BE8
MVVSTGDLAVQADVGHLASAAGLVPVPRDSGRRTGHLHRPKRYSRRLRRVFYLSVRTNQHHPRRPQPRFLPQEARRGMQERPGCHRLGPASVLWALLRDHRVSTPAPPLAQVARPLSEAQSPPEAATACISPSSPGWCGVLR